jgi:hypothetical protein
VRRSSSLLLLPAASGLLTGRRGTETELPPVALHHLCELSGGRGELVVGEGRERTACSVHSSTNHSG